MKITGKCPKCESPDVLANVQVLDRADNARLTDLSLATYRNPDAFMFKGRQETCLSAWVCGACGFTEFYAEAPGDLKVGE